MSVYFKLKNSRQFHIKTRTTNRIGPHNSDVISVLVGCLLGNAHSKKSKSQIAGTILRFKQSDRHKDYLFFLYDFFYNRGYCTNSGPRQCTAFIKNFSICKKIHSGYEFNLFTFSSLNWLHDLFYVNGIKTITPEISKYLTPMSLAFLIMENGRLVKQSKSVIISTKDFTLQEVQLLRDIFKTNFDLDCTIRLLSKGKGDNPKNKYSLYIKVASMPRLRELVLPYILPSFRSKLGL